MYFAHTLLPEGFYNLNLLMKKSKMPAIGGQQPMHLLWSTYVEATQHLIMPNFETKIGGPR